MAKTFEREERLCALEGVTRSTVLPETTEETEVSESNKFDMVIPYGASEIDVPFGTITSAQFVLLRSTQPLQIELDGSVALPTEVTSFEYIVNSTSQGLSSMSLVNNSAENTCEADASVTIVIGGDAE